MDRLPAAATADAPPLDGRLGGSLASFERRYGKPIAGTPEDGADFDVPGIGVLFVQFQFAPDPNNPGRVGKRASPESPATVLTIHPNRATANAAADPDPADWSLAEAQKRVKKLLPSDAALSDFTPSVDRAAQTCASTALAAAFTSVAKAGCEINYVLPTKKTVSYVTVALSAGSDSPASSPANPCAGALAWSRDAGARLDQARELLDQVAALNESDAGAAAALHGLATKFTATGGRAGRRRDSAGDDGRQRPVDGGSARLCRRGQSGWRWHRRQDGTSSTPRSRA